MSETTFHLLFFGSGLGSLALMFALLRQKAKYLGLTLSEMMKRYKDQDRRPELLAASKRLMGDKAYRKKIRVFQFCYFLSIIIWGGTILYAFIV